MFDLIRGVLEQLLLYQQEKPKALEQYWSLDASSCIEDAGTKETQEQCKLDEREVVSRTEYWSLDQRIHAHPKRK